MADQLRISWHDSSWVPHLNPMNILDYFCQKSNPFYDKSCSNEVLKMQRRGLEHLQQMTGNEYILLHVQEPILYVIRKQERLGPETTAPLADYYILAGVVYQAPDLNSIIQSRVLNSALNLKSALEEFQSISNFNPSTGYKWTSQTEPTEKEKSHKRHTEYTQFQSKVANLMKNFNESN